MRGARAVWMSFVDGRVWVAMSWEKRVRVADSWMVSVTVGGGVGW